MRGVIICENNPRINHLFFADDTLLFIRNKIEDLETVRDILHKFEMVYGKKVNLSKSILFFSPNMPRN